MKIINKLRDKLKFNDVQKQKLQEINKKLPSNEEICKEILVKYNNKNTKIILDENIKNSYYVFLNNTIYLANNNNIKNAEYRLVLIAHECRHSLQSKLLQKLNFIFSNIELILFFILFVISIFKMINIQMLLIYMSFFIISIIFRFILEFDAVKKSIIISKKYIENKLSKEDAKIIDLSFSSKANLLFPIMILQLFFGKIIRAMILYLMYVYVK